MLMEIGSRENFRQMGTLGVEEEFYIVDEAGNPVSGTDRLVYAETPPEPLTDSLDHELFKCTIETKSPLMETPSAASEYLRTVRDALTQHAHEHGYQIAGAGLHPTARWRELEHAEKPRYRSQLDRIQYPQHRNTTAGVHVHVGVDDADKAVWIADRLRWHVSVILALSANSPIWDGYDTGLSSARAKIFENLPNTGIPTAFDDFDTFHSFERRMVKDGTIDDRGELWYDVRPHSEHGTVEMRAPDGQHDLDTTLAFVEYAHALVTDLAERYEDGESIACLRQELLDENKWRATRYGHAASFLTRNREGTASLGDIVDRECDRLGIRGIRDVFDSESGAQRQRRILDQQGVEAVTDSLLLR
jgi:carboxylate-amine ligase, YbdK family